MARAKRGFLEKPEESGGRINFHAYFSRPMRGLHAVNLFSAREFFTTADDNLWLASAFDGRV
jgi:hypothetical protein